MSSTEQYLDFVLDLLGELDDVAHRKMMGGYVLYYRGKVIGGIYRGDRFLLKVTPASERLLPEAPRAIPYEEAKEMAPRRGGGSRRTARRRRRDVGGATCTEEEEQEVGVWPRPRIRRDQGRAACSA